MTNCWLKIRNFSRFSFLRPPKSAEPRCARSGLDRVNQEALLGVPLAQFLLGSGRGHLLVDLAAPVGVLQDKIGHGYCALSTSLRALRNLKLEQLGVQRRVHLLLVEAEFE